jgi:hypothetical protein
MQRLGTSTEKAIRKLMTQPSILTTDRDIKGEALG